MPDKASADKEVRKQKEASVHPVALGFGSPDRSLGVVADFHNRIRHYRMARVAQTNATHTKMAISLDGLRFTGAAINPELIDELDGHHFLSSAINMKTKGR